jgi:hypothetical protein
MRDSSWGAGIRAHTILLANDGINVIIRLKLNSKPIIPPLQKVRQLGLLRAEDDIPADATSVPHTGAPGERFATIDARGNIAGA